MKKFILKVIGLTIIAFVGVLMVSFCSFFILRNVWANNYQRGLVYQYRSLERSRPTGNRIIVLGGSYLSFCLDAPLLRTLSGYEVYPLGVNSGMGMRYIFELAEKFIAKGDVVVMPILFSDDFTSYGMPLIWISIGDEPDMLVDFALSHPWEVAKTFGNATLKRWRGKFFADLISNSTGLYDANCFNPENGDYIKVRREYERQFKTAGSYKPFAKLMPESNKCVLNDLAEFCRVRGARCVWSYAPSPRMAFGDDLSVCDTYDADIRACLKGKLVSKARNYLFPTGMLYDSLAHLNSEGARLWTRRLYSDIKEVLGCKEK